MPVRLAREDARRVAITAQLLTAERPAGIVETIDALGTVNIELTAAVAPSAHHILWSRIGWPYDPADLTRLVEVDRAVFEWEGVYRPMTDLPLLRAEMRTRPRTVYGREWLSANSGFRDEVLARLRAEGPLRPADIPDTAQVSWRSTGWTNNRNSLQMLEILVATGDVAVAARDAGGRRFDLAERVYPPDLPEIEAGDAARERAERRLGALGIARPRDLVRTGEPADAREIGDEATIDGVRGSWRVDPDAVARLRDFAPRTALLSPFDRLVFDRKRLEEVFRFEYILEMYKPVAKRRWGYFALPILHGDRLIGRLDSAADSRAGVFRVRAIHEDEPLDDAARDAVNHEIRELARWLGLELADPVG